MSGSRFGGRAASPEESPRISVRDWAFDLGRSQARSHLDVYGCIVRQGRLPKSVDGNSRHSDIDMIGAICQSAESYLSQRMSTLPTNGGTLPLSFQDRERTCSWVPRNRL